MSDKLPTHIIRRYGSSRGFRQHKRAALRDLKSALAELRLGSGYFPSGPGAVERIDYEVKLLERDLSEKSWGK